MKDSEFAKRLSKACDRNELVPPYGYGRQTWLKEHMKVSHEAVRKWVQGESRPRPAKMKQLATLLGVDEAWLSLGVEPEATPQEHKARSAKLAGAANVFMGLLQASGASVAFPDEPQPPVDFYAILNGKHLAFHVVLAYKADASNVTFRVPPEFDRCTVIGAVRQDAMGMEFVVLPKAIIQQYGTHHGGYVELALSPRTGHYVVDGQKVSRIENFDGITAA